MHRKELPTIARSTRLPSRAPLHVAATAFIVIGLAGPTMLAFGADPRPYAWMIAPLWLVVIACIGLWLRSFHAARADGARKNQPRAEKDNREG